MLVPGKSDTQREKRIKAKVWDGEQWERRRGEKEGRHGGGRVVRGDHLHEVRNVENRNPRILVPGRETIVGSQVWFIPHEMEAPPRAGEGLLCFRGYPELFSNCP